MYLRRLNQNKKLKLKIVCILLCITVTISFLLYKMHPIIIEYAISVAETIMLDCANEAIVDILEERNVSYNDIVRLTSNSEGYVTSLEIDVYEINNLKSQISSTLSTLIENEEYYNFSIPIGTFLGNTYANGFGPKLKFKMQLTTTAFVDFEHKFESAGINQVLHIIVIKIKIYGSLIIAGFSKTINTSTSAIAAQTVIVGKSPEAFTTVIESETDNTGGLVNDYGALIE